MDPGHKARDDTYQRLDPQPVGGQVPEGALGLGVDFAAVESEILQGARVEAVQHAPLPAHLQGELEDGEEACNPASELRYP